MSNHTKTFIQMQGCCCGISQKTRNVCHASTPIDVFPISGTLTRSVLFATTRGCLICFSHNSDRDTNAQKSQDMPGPICPLFIYRKGAVQVLSLHSSQETRVARYGCKFVCLGKPAQFNLVTSGLHASLQIYQVKGGLKCFK